MSYFATEYTIHFDDTMAYGSHHFMTGFKFQCASRESFLFGEKIFDEPGVRESLDQIHLFTADAYSRNLSPARLGDRLALLLTLEEWGRASARFCYRVINEKGTAICAGFQTLICADAKTGKPISLPDPLWDAMETMRAIEEPLVTQSFRERVLAGGRKLESLFGDGERQAAVQFLSRRYPSPEVIDARSQNRQLDANAKTNSKRIEFDTTEVISLPELFNEDDSKTESTGENRAFLSDDFARQNANPENVSPEVAPFENAASEKTSSERTQPENVTLHSDVNHVAPTVREAWVFSGQGSFNAQLLSERIAQYCQLQESGRREIDECAAIASELLGGNASALVSGFRHECQSAVAETPNLSQVAIYLQNALGASLRRIHGQTPSILLGHSFGEIAALGAAGCFNLLNGTRIVCRRVKAISQYAPVDAGLLVAFADRQLVATEITLLGFDRLVIAGRNYDKQTVVSGSTEQLDRLREYLRGININATTIPSPTSFHHPQLRTASKAWMKELQRLPIEKPAFTVYSPIGRRFLSADDDITSTLVSQFILPFDLQGSIHDVLESGVTRFVDCGSTGSLAKIISKAGPDGLDVCVCDDVADALKKIRADVPRAKIDVSRLKYREEIAASIVSSERPRVENRNQPISLVAIVGKGCILPGGASSPAQLFAAITEQRLGIVDQRSYDPNWSADFYSEKLVADRSTSHLTGRVNEADIVAPIGVGQGVFDRFTRTQRLLCIALVPCVASLQDAGRILCLVGATADGFEDQDVVSSLELAGIDPTDPDIDQLMSTARSAFQVPHSAIQDVFDVIVRPGLEITLVDAACASSLYAVALGMRALEANEADAVIAGGVFCPGQGNSCLFSQFQGTTSTGCRPFDANADGVVFSEGSALVTLRRVGDAERLGLSISAIVRGAGLSSDGKSSSANVPQTNGQLLSLERCYADYEIDPSTVQAIEGHGTSTPVGDSTEVNTLREFFAGRLAKPIPLHSLKGLLGHAGWAAGTASIIAVCEYMRNGTFPAQANFKEPSQAVLDAAETLTIPTEPIQLPAGKRRLAVDGFGFGGSNAHLILESYLPIESNANETPRNIRGARTSKSELVIAAYHKVAPTLKTTNGMRFDRDAIELPEGHVLLPDLADDMDISQTLAILLVDQTILQLPEFHDGLRQATGIVLAQRGKTDRGVEATMRVLAQRFRRSLTGSGPLIEKLDTALDRTRPSGAYTLQCMMPNVSAGRAALQSNLNGPNFVVDSGANSFEAAIEAASLLLRSGDRGGTKLVVVAAIDANRRHTSTSENAEDEFAAAFAVTTRQLAQASGLPVVADVDDVLRPADGRQADAAMPTTGSKVRACLHNLEAKRSKAGSAKNTDGFFEEKTPSKFPIHNPVWVEAPLDLSHSERLGPVRVWNDGGVVAIVRADDRRLSDLLQVLPQRSPRHLVVAVGPSATDVVAKIQDSSVVAMDVTNVENWAETIRQIREFNANAVVAIESASSWQLEKTLDHVATQNEICECLFLIAKELCVELCRGEIELWGLALGAWNGVVHPATGAVSGLLKSIKREFPRPRIGSIVLRAHAMDNAWQRLEVERAHRQDNDEIEIVYDHGSRLVRRLRAASDMVENPQVALDSNSVVVATGGARGVTAVMVDALIRDYQCRVVTIGRSELEAGPATEDDGQAEQDFYDRYLREHPSASPVDMKRSFESARARWEAHATVQKLASLGGHVDYVVADVTDPEHIAQVVRDVLSKYGRIDLLVHGAGIQLSKRLDRRSLDEFRRTYEVKVRGLRNLVAACLEQTGKLPSVHVLTSAYSIFGNDGQHDYGAANETLDRLCGLSTEGAHSSWSSVAWLAWDGVGMTRGSEYRALANQRGLSGLTPVDGQDVFRRVLTGRAGSAINAPMTEAEHVKYAIKTVPPKRRPANGRMIEVPVELARVECLPFHKVRSTPTLPGAWILDHLVKAGLRLRGQADGAIAVTICNANFARFVRHSSQHEPNLRAIAEETEDGVDVWMIGDVLHPTGVTLSKDIVFAQASLVFSREAASVQSSLKSIRHGQPSNSRFLTDPYCDGRSGDVELSGLFDCVRDIQIESMGRRATFVPQPSTDEAGVIPALLLDSAWRVGAMYAVPEEHGLYVPVRIDRLVVPLGMKASANSAAGWEIRTTAPRVEQKTVRWDRTEVLDQLGDVKLIVENTFATRLN